MGAAYSATVEVGGTSGESKQYCRASSIRGERSETSRSRASSQAGPTAGSGSRTSTATSLVEVMTSSSNGPSTAKAMTVLPKKSVRSVQLTGVGLTSTVFDRQVWRSVSRGRRWASLRQRETGAL